MKTKRRSGPNQFVPLTGSSAKASSKGGTANRDIRAVTMGNSFITQQKVDGREWPDDLFRPNCEAPEEVMACRLPLQLVSSCPTCAKCTQQVHCNQYEEFVYGLPLNSPKFAAPTDVNFLSCCHMTRHDRGHHNTLNKCLYFQHMVLHMQSNTSMLGVAQ